VRQQRERADRAEGDGVAVGRGFRHRVHADRPAGAAAVLHHHLLAERGASFSASRRATASLVPPGG
jgi:hypothetical protein